MLWTEPLRQRQEQFRFQINQSAEWSSAVSVLPQRRDAPCEIYKKQL